MRGFLSLEEEGALAPSNPSPFPSRLEDAITRALDDLVDIGYYSFDDEAIIVLDRERPYFYTY
jgi:hypothetical protein